MLSISILKEKNNYINAINKINDTNCDYLHLDIMDSSLTLDSSFKIEQVKEISKLSNKKLDIHIMSTKLDEILDDYIKIKPDIISIHFEATSNIKKYIKMIKENNIKVGLAISPDTFVSEIYEYIDLLDVILVLGVYPGKSGQSYIESTTKKLIQLDTMKDAHKYLIEVDGGINEEIINIVKNYIDIAVVGSYITNYDDYQKQIDKLNM